VYRFGTPDATVKHPFAFTLDNDSIGWNPRTGETSGPIDSTRILERLGSYMNGTQPQALGLEGVTQARPQQFDIAKLKSDLGGRFPNFEPVNGKYEAAAISHETGETVLTREAELAKIQEAVKGRGSARFFGLAAESASNAAYEVGYGSDYFNEGLRAALDA